MARLLKLLVALAILYATYQGTLVFWRNYQFKDAINAIAMSGTRNSNVQIQTRVQSAAAQLNIPLAPEQISVSRTGDRLTVEATYLEQIEFLPGYRYPYVFTARGQAPILP